MRQGKTGEYIVVSGKIYAVCDVCRQLVRINKPIFGSLHLCLTDEEISQKETRDNAKNEDTD